MTNNLYERTVGGRAAVTVWGAGYIGLSSSLAFAQAGFKVTTFDPNDVLVAGLRRGDVPFVGFERWCSIPIDEVGGLVDFTAQMSDSVLGADIHVVCVGTDVGRSPERRSLFDVAASIGCAPVGQERLVVIESTVSPSWLEEFALVAAGDSPPDQVMFGCAPRRDWFVDESLNLGSLPRVVGGSTPQATELVAALYRTVSNEVLPASSWVQASLVKVIENSHRFLSIVFANQLAAAYADIDTAEALRLASTKWNMPLVQPSIGIGGYCIPTAPRYLLDENRRLPMLNSAIEWDGEHATRIASRIIETHRPDRIAILGVSYAPNLRVDRVSPSIELARALAEDGVAVEIHDPYYEPDEIAALCRLPVLRFPDDLAAADVVLVATAHDEYVEPLSTLMSRPDPPSIIDNLGTLAAVLNGSPNYSDLGSLQARRGSNLTVGQRDECRDPVVTDRLAPTSSGRQHHYHGAGLDQPIIDELTVVDFLRGHAERGADSPFLTMIAGDQGDEEHFVTYGQLWRDVESRAGWLQHHLDAGPGSYLGVSMANDYNSIVNLLSVAASGAATVVVGGDSPARRLAAQFAQTEVTYALGLEPGSCNSVEIVEAGQGSGYRRPAIRSDEAGFVFFTSGSTGSSKAVVQGHYGSLVNDVATVRHHRMKAGERILGCLPLSHVNGLHFTVLSTIVARSHLMLAPEFDAVKIGGWVEAYRPRLFSAVPSILQAMVDGHRRRPADYSALDYVMTAAAPVSGSLVRAFREQLGTKVVQGYGLSETTNFTSTMPIDLADDLYRSLMERDRPPVGVALDGNEVAILADGVYHREPGTVGEVCVRGHNVMLRYHRADDLTAKAFAGGWFHTGDIGTIERCGEMDLLTLRGRLKNMVKVAGMSVSLDEIDNLLLTASGVVDGASLAVDDSVLGERVVAVVSTTDPMTTAESVKEQLGHDLPPGHLPSDIIIVDCVPRSPTGKIKRTELKDLYERVRSSA